MRWRQADPLPRSALAAGAAGTVVVHAGIVTALILAVFLEPRTIQPTIYAVELVAAPAQSRPAARRPVETPAPPPPPAVAPKPDRAAPVPAP
jgi:hypothetical protein